MNPLIGTGGHGHTFPGASSPFGMVQLSPDTRVEGWDACAGYHYTDSTILGFSHTHLSGTGIPDFGDFLFMPSAGVPECWYVEGAKAERFSHERESATPGYYRVFLEDSGILAELTATERVGLHRYTFTQSVESTVLINLRHGLGPDKVLESWIRVTGDNELQGYRRSSGWAKDQRVYFHAKFSTPIRSVTLAADGNIIPGAGEASGENVQCLVSVVPDQDDAVVMKVGISSVSVEGALENLDHEVPGCHFDSVREGVRGRWNRELSKIEIGGADEHRVTFYTSLYHTMLAPNIANDVNGEYRGMDGTIRIAEGFNLYTVFSLWDTFRAEHPLLTIIDESRTRDFVGSFLARYQESGALPVWELASNETWTMIGYHAVPVIVDAYVKGIRGFDAEEAFRAMKESALADRFGLDSYRTHGYIPGDSEGESVSKTLEYSYDDWCIGRMAELLGREDDARLFYRRARSYQNLYDPLTGFMRPKVNSTWVEPFEPASVTFHYTEANSWQYSFFAPQDVNGLVELTGGDGEFIKKLDSLFSSRSEMNGRQQPDITGLIGQYAHGNEPSHHIPYLYNYAGAPWRTQEIVRKIMDSLYTDKPDGLCGNEDCGQLSAWYIMSALGFYQVCPGQPIYCIGSPLFRNVTLHLGNGRRFVIETQHTGDRNTYIRSGKLNGSTMARSYIRHDEILEGGNLTLVMGMEPNTDWGFATAERPHSPLRGTSVIMPAAYAANEYFRDSMIVSLASPTEGVEIFYSLDASAPTAASQRYSHPLTFFESVLLKAIAIAETGSSSDVMTAEFVRYEPVGTIRLRKEYSTQYTGGGENALIDHRRGAADWKLGAWQGYEGNDLEAEIDLGTGKTIRHVALSCLQDNNAWIFFPTSVEFSFSWDRKRWRNVLTVRNEISPAEPGVLLKEFGGGLEQVRGRYVRIRAESIGVCPDWHKGAGGKAWLFADEILVETLE